LRCCAYHISSQFIQHSLLLLCTTINHSIYQFILINESYVQQVRLKTRIEQEKTISYVRNNVDYSAQVATQQEHLVNEQTAII